MCVFSIVLTLVETEVKVNKLSQQIAALEDRQSLSEEKAEEISVSLFYLDNVVQQIKRPQKDDNKETEIITTVEKEDESEQNGDYVEQQFDKTEKEVGKNVELPDLPTDRKVCTDYSVYNIPGTPHNRMQQLAQTDELGCRRYGVYYIVGLGSAYADRIGETFEVELDTGEIFRIITGDMKADIHTDVTNRYAPMMNYNGEQCANILEFIIDKNVLDNAAYRWGGVDYYTKFKGNIVRMTYLGRDTSADWDTYL